MPARSHGHSMPPSPTYNSWRGMVERCMPSNPYGVRGVSICARWRSFQNFLDDMGERPPGCEIDRIDLRKGYNPKNCRWLDERTNKQLRTHTVLTKEKRDKILTMRKGGMSYSVIAKEIGVSKSCVGQFIRGESWG